MAAPLKMSEEGFHYDFFSPGSYLIGTNAYLLPGVLG